VDVAPKSLVYYLNKGIAQRVSNLSLLKNIIISGLFSDRLLCITFIFNVQQCIYFYCVLLY